MGQQPERAHRELMARRFAVLTVLVCLVGGVALGACQPAAGTLTPPGSAASTQAGLQVGLEVGNLAPDFTAKTEAGEEVTLSALRGKVVLLNFWATWCGPCVIEMPAIQREYQRRAQDGFVVLAINNRETAAEIAPFRERFALTFPIVLDPRGELQEQYTVVSYPSSLFLDQQGVIVARHLGVLTPKQMAEVLSGLLP
jgi:peroxiredoxin